LDENLNYELLIKDSAKRPRLFFIKKSAVNFIDLPPILYITIYCPESSRLDGPASLEIAGYPKTNAGQYD
jgi:hypothetical protein